MVKMEAAGVKLEPGESSEGQTWAKLESWLSDDCDIEIRSNEMIICSEEQQQQQWCQITRNSDLCSATLTNLSSTGILVDGICVDKQETLLLNSATHIISGYKTYRFRLMGVPENKKKHMKIPLDYEHAKCSICLHIWHDVVTVAPCLHNFCNGCFSEWLKRSQKKHSNVPCPQCRADVYCVGRNHLLRNVEEGILESDLSLKRSSEELAVLDGNASIQSNLIISSRNLHSRKRPYSPVNEDVQVDSPCPQCGSNFGGYHCSQSTPHIQCQACGGRMPARADISVPQHCLGCDRAFCWSYWRAQGLFTSDAYTICRQDNFKPISEYITSSSSRMPLLIHESNRIEQDITERCIGLSGKTLENLISDWIHKLNNKEIDVSRMPLKHAEAITSGTYVCRDCYDKLVSFLLYWYRVTIPKHHLPADVAGREDCWYGYACRTQHRNPDHARKRNHVCRPTRGTGM